MKKISISLFLLVGCLAFAGGFRVSLQGVKQLAMAHTSAHAEDASVAFFNPAGISFIPAKLSVAAGGFGIMSKVTYQNLTTLENNQTNNPIGTPFYAAVAYKVSEKLSLGFSVTTPFGSTIDWGNDWAGNAIVQKTTLKAFYFQPMLSVKLAPWASLGASYIYAKGEINSDRALVLPNGSINLMDSKASGQGFSFGFYFQPDNNWDISIAYRSPVDMEAKNGVATFNISKALYSNLKLDANGQDTFTGSLPLVDEYTLGVTYKVTPKWSVSGDFNYSGWSAYNNLKIKFANAPVASFDNPTNPTESITPKNFRNTKTFRLGTQYWITEKVAARAGWYWDESPYQDGDFSPETPSFESNIATAGVGLKFGRIGVDLAAAYSFAKARTFNNEYYNFSGQMKAKAYFFGLGFSYNLK